MAALKVVKPADLRRALEITDSLGLHREAVRVSLEPKPAGTLRIAGPHLLISLPETEVDVWLAGLAARVAAVEGVGALKRSG